MAHLDINLLGTFQVLVDGHPAHFATDKCRALLAYLALESERSHRREALSGLFWPERPETAARSNLRQTLHRLRISLGQENRLKPHLRISVHAIQFNPDGDFCLDAGQFDFLVGVFKNHCGGGSQLCGRCRNALEGASALYRGALMDGFSLSGCPSFELWLLSRQEHYHRHALAILHRLAGWYEEVGDSARTIEYARRLIYLEPWHEAYHRLLIRALVRTGRRHAALAEYERCRQLLGEEMGTQPSEKTVGLYQQILAGDEERWAG